MLRHAIASVLLAYFCFSGLMQPVAAKSDEEKKAEIFQAAIQYVTQYGDVRDTNALAKAYPGIEKTWQAFRPLVAADNGMVTQFAFMRARAATAAGAKGRVVEAWRTALKYKKPGTTPQELIGINIEAAHAAASVDDYETAKQFFAAARAYSFVRGEDSGNARLHMRIRELSVIGGSMPWRDLNDALTDLKKFSETFPMWTLPRLEAIVAETEIRLRFQPEGEDKRLDLSRLKAEIVLIVDGLDENLPAGYLTRVRRVYYALEDGYQL